MKKMALVIAVCLMVMAFAGVAFAGELVIKGSTTVLPIAQAGAEKFMEANSDVKVSVSGGGSGNGIKALIDGSTDIADASRFIKDQEVKACCEKGIYPVPHAVAMDAIVPVVHPDNPVKNLTLDQMKKIYMGEITNWKEVGGPSMAIAVVGRDTSSGTYEVWEKLVMDKERVTERALVVASNGAMVQTVTKNKLSVGYVGIGYLSDEVKGLTVNDIEATVENAKNGVYPVSRYLYMFTNGWPKGDAGKFITFILSAAGQEIVANEGYVPVR